MDWETIVVAIIAGVSSSFLSPFITHLVEIRKSKYEYRKETIKRWREELSKCLLDSNSSVLTFDVDHNVLYSEVRPYLSEETIDFVEKDNTIVIVDNKGIYRPEMKILQDISTLEKKWKLLD